MTEVAPQNAPLVSIVLPTFNRAQFMEQAFESMRSQTWTDWELIVVDDGSTDDTRKAVERESNRTEQFVKYISQENGGAAMARNAGVDHARGRYIAFFDSDDRWLAHHLTDCVEALEKQDEVDWVYAACRRLEFSTGVERAASSFYVDEHPRPFLGLHTRHAGSLRIIDDPGVTAMMIEYGLMCGLQTSVLRRAVFDHLRLPIVPIVEDQMFAVRALKTGVRLAYFDDIHVLYNVHDANVSASAMGADIDQRLRIAQIQLNAYEDIRKSVGFSPAEERALDRRMGRDCFWTIGYALLWRNDRRSEALAMFRRGLRHWPWSLKCWKTYVVSWLKACCSKAQA